MATGVAERAVAPGVSTVPPPGSVRVRAAGVTWGWRVFLGAVYPPVVRAAGDLGPVQLQRLEHPGVPAGGRDVALVRRRLPRPAPSRSAGQLRRRRGDRGAGVPRARHAGRVRADTVPVPRPVGGGRARRRAVDPAVADHRHRGVDVLRALRRRPVAEDGRGDPDRVHVPVGDGDRGRAVVPIPARAGGGCDRPRLLAHAGACATSSCRISRRRWRRARSSRSPGRSTTTRSARSRSGSSRRSPCGCTPTCATRTTPPSSTRSRRSSRSCRSC